MRGCASIAAQWWPDDERSECVCRGGDTIAGGWKCVDRANQLDDERVCVHVGDATGQRVCVHVGDATGQRVCVIANVCEDLLMRVIANACLGSVMWRCVCMCMLREGQPHVGLVEGGLSKGSNPCEEVMQLKLLKVILVVATRFSWCWINKSDTLHRIN